MRYPKIGEDQVLRYKTKWLNVEIFHEASQNSPFTKADFIDKKIGVVATSPIPTIIQSRIDELVASKDIGRAMALKRLFFKYNGHYTGFFDTIDEAMDKVDEYESANFMRLASGPMIVTEELPTPPVTVVYGKDAFNAVLDSICGG